MQATVHQLWRFKEKFERFFEETIDWSGFETMTKLLETKDVEIERLTERIRDLEGDVSRLDSAVARMEDSISRLENPGMY